MIKRLPLRMPASPLRRGHLLAIRPGQSTQPPEIPKLPAEPAP